ncbi:hypothetical protein [Streptomyces yanii]|uniref:Uncharacterized protein n=1 Tax=Streptomyces yanii TaxID=78510 RepID=A0ABV5RFG2_9ACTN
MSRRVHGGEVRGRLIDCAVPLLSTAAKSLSAELSAAWVTTSSVARLLDPGERRATRLEARAQLLIGSA